MVRITFLFALVLVAIGVGFYVGTDGASPTALIPAGFGLLIALCGWFALDEKKRMHAMHAAVLLALIGFGATVKGVVDLLSGLGSEEGVSAPSWGRAAMALTCLVYVVFAVRSFIQARRAREASGG